jgi:hypothetical protein
MQNFQKRKLIIMFVPASKGQKRKDRFKKLPFHQIIFYPTIRFSPLEEAFLIKKAESNANILPKNPYKNRR